MPGVPTASCAGVIRNEPESVTNLAQTGRAPIESSDPFAAEATAQRLHQTPGYLAPAEYEWRAGGPT